MAPRKKATSRASTTPDTLKVKQGIFNPSKVLKSAKALKSPANASADAITKRTWEPKKLENGLLDVGNIPPWMLEVTKRNATESSLLRLPGELRNKIWQYATTGNIVNLHNGYDSKLSRLICEGHTVGIVGEDNPMRWLSTCAEDKPRLPTALHLSEVCRQIYHEAGALAYSESIFFFCEWDDRGKLMRRWARALNPAHKGAIEDIAMDEENLSTYLIGRSRLRYCFPDLQHLHLNKDRVNNTPGLSDFYTQLPLDLEETLQKLIDERENGNVKLVWHEHPIENYKITGDEAMGDSSSDEGAMERNSEMPDTRPS